MHLKEGLEPAGYAGFGLHVRGQMLARWARLRAQSG
jgi:hypothetical protein